MTPAEFHAEVEELYAHALRLRDRALEGLEVNVATATALGVLASIVQLLNMLSDAKEPYSDDEKTFEAEEHTEFLALPEAIAPWRKALLRFEGRFLFQVRSLELAEGFCVESVRIGRYVQEPEQFPWRVCSVGELIDVQVANETNTVRHVSLSLHGNRIK